MPIVEQIWTFIKSELTGFDLLFAVVMLLITTAFWRYVGAGKAERKKLKRQIPFAVVMALFTGSIIAIHWAWPSAPFKQGSVGILVAMIPGDDATNTLQRQLVGNLNSAIATESGNANIEIHASKHGVEEKGGLSVAHNDARSLGEKYNATLVIWGNRIGAKGFIPRITVTHPDSGLPPDRTLAPQQIDEISLPSVTVEQPIYLVHFILGFSLYDQRKRGEALQQFELAVRSGQATSEESADLLFFIGSCRVDVAMGRKDMSAQLTQAIAELTTAVESYTSSRNAEKIARVQNNLGNAYGDLRTGDRSENIRTAIALYEKALEVYTETKYPTRWAQTQNNLGTTYHDLPTGDRTQNLRNAIAAYQSALRIYTERKYPYEWARTVNNLGTAYTDLPTGDSEANFTTAVEAYEAALRVRKETTYPDDWAQTQTNLGITYYQAPAGDRNRNLESAISAFEAALRVRTEQRTPMDWATTQASLSAAYAALKSGDLKENLRKSVDAAKVALRIFTQDTYPFDWAQTQNNLGIAYGKLAAIGDAESFAHAVDAYESACRVLTKNTYPIDWAKAQNNLGVLYKDRAPNTRSDFAKAKEYFAKALTVFTEQAFPEYYEAVNQNVQETNAALSKLQ